MAESEEGERLAAELRRIREAVRDRALLSGGAQTAPAAIVTRTPVPVPRDAETVAEATPERPDGAAINALWDVSKTPPVGVLGRLVGRALAPFVTAQTTWNARQVQFDNDLLDYIDRRADATHRHYDRILGIHGRHIDDVNERHLILQEELVAHVHDLVKRIELVLGEAEKGRLSLEFALRDVRTRLARLEEHLARG